MDYENAIVSVIIPCYNNAEYIEEAIKSVIDQTYPYWECIIINDGSTDNTEATVAPYLADTRIKYYRQENKGVSAARNLGVKYSKGNYIQFLDGDDILEADKFKLQLDFLVSNQAVDIVFGGTRYFLHGSFDNKLLLNEGGGAPTVEVHYLDENQTAALLQRNLTTICAPLYRRSIFSTCHFEDIIFEDWVFHIECSLKGRKFHFERIAGTNSYVRITRGSQYHRHSSAPAKTQKMFIERVNELVKSYNYRSPIKSIFDEETTNNGAKKVIKLLLPPVFLVIYRLIKAK